MAGPEVVRPGDDVVFSVTVRSTLDEPQTVDWTHAPAVWLEDDRTGAVVWASYLRGSTQSIKHLDLPARGERTYRFAWPHEVCDTPSATRPGELSPGSYRLHARWTLHDGHVNATPVAVTAR